VHGEKLNVADPLTLQLFCQQWPPKFPLTGAPAACGHQRQNIEVRRQIEVEKRRWNWQNKANGSPTATCSMEGRWPGL